MVKFLHAEFSAEIERGSTYPMEQAMGLEQFAEYWFGTFAVVAVLDGEEEGEGLEEGREWEKVCLGTFYIKPNYPGMSDRHLLTMYCLCKWIVYLGVVLMMIAGRCSHICNAGFLTTTAARGKGVGQQMGEAYLEFAPKLVCINPCMNFEFPLAETDLCSVGIQILRLQPGLR